MCWETACCKRPSCPQRSRLQRSCTARACPGKAYARVGTVKGPGFGGEGYGYAVPLLVGCLDLWCFRGQHKLAQSVMTLSTLKSRAAALRTAASSAADTNAVASSAAASSAAAPTAAASNATAIRAAASCTAASNAAVSRGLQWPALVGANCLEWRHYTQTHVHPCTPAQVHKHTRMHTHQMASTTSANRSLKKDWNM